MSGLRGWRAFFFACAVLAASGLTAFVLHRKHEFRNIHGSSSVEFVTTQAKPTRPEEGVAWPRYGFDLAGTRNAGYRLRPPFRRVWAFNNNATLLEFPPAVAYGKLFLPTWDGRFLALDARTGHLLWRHRSGRCGWGTPVVWRLLVINTYIGHECGSPIPGTDGEIVAYAQRTGAVRWRFRLGPCESSPLVVGGLVYAGDWHGHVYALDVRTGKQVWRASAQPRLGHTGWFYSSPAIAHGRVFIGSTDGKVYSYGARSGKLRWSYTTGGYVYASPAVWRDRVLVGSLDGVFYAFDAATGAVRWRFRANGGISGSASIVDGVVYFSTLAHRTYGLEARTGRAVWIYPDGEYTPVVADSHRLYVVGYRRVYAFIQRARS